MLRRASIFCCKASSASWCVASLSIPVPEAAAKAATQQRQQEHATFWEQQHLQSPSSLAIAANFFASLPSDAHRAMSRELVHPAAFAVLECLEPKHVADLDVAVRAMQRWTQLDDSDAVTQLLASSPESQSNLVGALVCHQRSTVFVAHAARAIANCVLLMSQTARSSNNNNNSDEEEINKTSGSSSRSKFATSEVITILIQTLMHDSLLGIEKGRGAAWVLQALQNLILQDDEAALHACAFSWTGATSSHDGTAEHVVATTLCRILASGGGWNQLLRFQSWEEAAAASALRIRIASLDSGLACIARLMSMASSQVAPSSDKTAAAFSSTSAAVDNTSTVHRLEHASAEIFRAVAQSLHSDSAQLSVELQHKGWECLQRLVVGCPDNIGPLLAALHEADGQSGFKILGRWLEATLADLSVCCCCSSSSAALQEQQQQQQQRGGDDEDEQRHEKQLRMQCGFAVLLELTGASVFSNRGSDSSSAIDQQQQQQPEETAEDDEKAHSVSEYDAKTKRLDSAMASISSGTLSQFASRMMLLLNEESNRGSSGGKQPDTAVISSTQAACLQLLLNLSQSDPFVRSRNQLVTLQRAVFWPVLADVQRQKKTVDVASATNCQRAMSIVWNALNFNDAVAGVRELKLKEDVQKIVLAVKELPEPKATSSDSPSSGADTTAEQLRGAGEKLLEKMAAIL